MFFKLYAIALPIFFAIDMLWLGVVAKNLYKNQLGYLMTPNVNWIAAIVFYLLFIVGLVVFIISPAMEKHSIMHAVLYGALFGLISYATYDLTNLATVKDWPILITGIDLVWGSVLAALVCSATVAIATKIGL
jgi:uncharacterized membrane protein